MSNIDVTIENISEVTVTVDDDRENITVVLQPATSGGGAVDSVNGQTGVVVLDADDLSDAATTNKFVTSADLTKLSNLSGTNTGDQDLSWLMVKSNNLSDLTNVSTARTNLGVDPAGTDNSTPVTLNQNEFNFVSLAGQVLTLQAIAISEVTGLQTALDGKQASGSYATTTDLTNGLATKEPTITAGTTGQYWRGDKSWQTLDKSVVGLGNVVNANTTTTANITDSPNKRFVTDANLAVIGNTSGTNTGDQTITLTGDVTGSGTGSFAATLANTTVTPGTYGSAGSVGTFTVDTKGRLTAAGSTAISITESQISDLGTSAALVSDNLSVFASTTSSQLAGIVPDKTGSGALVFATSPALAGTPTAPTATPGTNTTQIATTAFTQAALAAITEGLTIVQTNSTTLAPTTGNYYLVDGTTTVNLPAGSNGDVIGIADGASNFGTANCTINPNGAQTIAGENAVTLTADNAFFVLAFWGTRWTIIHSNSFIQPDPSPLITTLTTGAGSFVQNASSRLLRVRVWGSTGGSGGVDGVASTVAIGGSGGNGGYAEKWITIAPGETFTYAVGAAGIGGAAGANNGTAGGTTSFTGSVSGTVQVTGGAGGTGVTGTATGQIGQSSGGVATGGDLDLTGGRSMVARWVSGVVYSYPSNSAPMFGFGRINTAGAGIASGGIGAGAVGAVSTDATNFAGADGFRGQIIVEEWE
jgi:hypothetical protein